MIACPACKRASIGRRELLSASIDGAARCPACGGLARLDGLSRCMVTCILALLLWMVLLHGNILFSGYLFVFSTIVVIGGWRLLSAAALPIVTLEKMPGGTCFDRRQSIAMLAALIVTAVVVDALMAYRSEADRSRADSRPGVSARSY